MPTQLERMNLTDYHISIMVYSERITVVQTSLRSSRTMGAFFLKTWHYHSSILLQQLSFIAPLRKLLNLIAFVIKLMHICTCKLNLCLQFRITSIVFTRQRRRCVFSNQSHPEKEDKATNFKMGMSQTIISHRCYYTPPPYKSIPNATISRLIVC